MLSDLPDDGRRTVYCRRCETWRRPSHPCARDPGHETTPLSVLYLRREGPSTLTGVETLPADPSRGVRRERSVARFDPPLGPSGHTAGESTRPVYYLATEHDPAEVLARWLTANAEALRGTGTTTEDVSRALSKQSFKRAWRALRGRREFAFLETPDRANVGGGGGSPRTCPFCGEEIPRLPDHLPCPEA